MDYEKAYKQALERARQIKDGKDEWRYSDIAEITPALTEIFPELRESEDERIRKFICSIIDNLEPKDFVGVKKMNVLAWLERQKEQKPVELSGELSTNDSSNPSGLVARNLTPEQMREETLKPVETSDFKTKLAEYMTKNRTGYSYSISSESILEMAKEELIKRGVVVEREQCCMGIKGDPDPAGVWKPTEEHLSALLAIFNDPNNIGSQTCQLALTDLYEQLKKL